MNASLTRTPPPLSAAAPSAKPGIRTPRRAAPPVGLGRNRIEAAGQARRGAHERSLTSQGARRIRSAPAATEPRRHPDPAAAAVLRNLESRRPKAKAFSTEFLLIIGGKRGRLGFSGLGSAWEVLNFGERRPTNGVGVREEAARSGVARTVGMSGTRGTGGSEPSGRRVRLPLRGFSNANGWLLGWAVTITQFYLTIPDNCFTYL